MKKLLVALLLSIICMTANANGIKLYIGSIETVTKDFKTGFYMKLVLCNNTTDTIFLPVSQITRTSPVLTHDLSILVDGGPCIALTNVPDMVEDLTTLKDLMVPPDRYGTPPVTDLDKSRIDANAALPWQVVEGLDCFVLAPGKCLTVNSLMIIFPPEFLKLHKVNKLQQEQMEANLVLPVEYYTPRNKSGKSIIMISRSSDELKAAILDAIKNK